MAIVRWSPFSELAEMRRQMQSLTGLMSTRFTPFGNEDRFIPAMDVTTRGDDLLVRLEIPAVDAEKDLDISVDQGMLRISGERSEERSQSDEGYYMREMRYGSFERSFPLPEGVGAEQVEAEYGDGILEVIVRGGAKQMAQSHAQHIRITRGSGTREQRQMAQGQEQREHRADGEAEQQHPSGESQRTPD